MERTREFWVTEVRPHGRKFRFSVLRAGEKPTYQSYDTEAEANDERAKFIRLYEAQGVRTIDKAIEEYEIYLADQTTGRRNKPRSVETAIRNVKTFFDAKTRTESLARLTETKCHSLYAECVKGRAADTHRNILKCAKAFTRWCVGKKWIKASPFVAECEHCKGLGRRKKGGKKQLRIDEVRKFMATALQLCMAIMGGAKLTGKKGGRPVRYGHAGPAAALAAFVFGMRADEVASREVRDLDDNGRLLWTDHTAHFTTKSEAGRRTNEVPEWFRPFLIALTKDKLPHAKLFGGKRWWVNAWVHRVCKLAQVDDVCAHSMRGLHSTLAIANGATAEQVMAALGWTDIKIGKQHYIQAGAMEKAAQDRVLEIVGEVKLPETAVR